MSNGAVSGGSAAKAANEKTPQNSLLTWVAQRIRQIAHKTKRLRFLVSIRKSPETSTMWHAAKAIKVSSDWKPKYSAHNATVF
ncbi:MAG: hypothetical protein JXR84_28065 [Anaerolineae bacterium]|nr:hypothetical protein [Anaerolineae bacterium]